MLLNDYVVGEVHTLSRCETGTHGTEVLGISPFEVMPPRGDRQITEVSE